jgi:hypothetical protein
VNVAIQRCILLAAAALALLGCQSRQSEGPTGGDGASGGAVLSGNQQEDEQLIQRLEGAARELARTDGCTDASQCAAAPVGAKACGGPRAYLPYCPLTTNTAELQSKLEELLLTERAYNVRYGIMSDCMLVTEPPLGLSDGRCVAVP